MYIYPITIIKTLPLGYQTLNGRQKLFDALSELQTERATNLYFVPQSGIEDPELSNQDSTVGTTLVNQTEAISKTNIIPRNYPLPKALLNSASDSTDPTIKFYMGKPVRIWTGAFTTTDTPSTFATYGVFDAIALNNVLKNKLIGNFSFRATTVVTLQVNANRFQAGRYILAYLPTGGATLNTPEFFDLLRMKRFSATQVTQLPHVELDLATDTQVQLRIPYCCYMTSTPVPKYGIASFVGNPGCIFIYPYMSLLSGSSINTANYVAWIHYEDVELFGNMAPQMGDIKEGNVRKLVSGVKSALDMEIFKPGPVEKAAMKVNGYASAANSVPLLSPFAGPIAWVTDAIAGVASIFGWSRPNDIEPVTRIMLRYNHNMSVSNEKDTTEILAQDIANNVGILPGYGATDEDQMSINFIKKQYAFYKVYNWTEANTVGDNLFILPLEPGQFQTQTADGVASVQSAVPVAFLSYLYQYYRGGLKFKIKIVKTEFHSGRLVFGFFPLDGAIDTSNASVIFDNLDFVQKTIVDVRENNEWEFEVPFVSTTPYKSCTIYGQPGEFYGYLGCWVLSDLVAPDGVTGTVKILVEVAGADDLEFAVPKRTGIASIVPLNILAQPQMADVTGSSTLSTIGTTANVTEDYVDAAYTMGEASTSLRQFLKRPYPGLSRTTNNENFVPDAITWHKNVTGTGLVQMPHDFIDLFGTMYALMRGGTKYRIIPKTTNNIQLRSTLYSWQWNSSPSPSYKTPYWSGATAPTMANRMSFANGLSSIQRMDYGYGITVPFYSKTYAKPTLANASSDSVTNYVWHPGFAGAFDHTLIVTCDDADTPVYEVLRYGADDKDFTCFTGCPPVTAMNYS